MSMDTALVVIDVQIVVVATVVHDAPCAGTWGPVEPVSRTECH